MDNLELTENGYLTMTGGTSVISTFTGETPVAIFSKVVAGVKYRYIAMTNGKIYRNGALIATSVTSVGLAAFGAGYGFVFAASGSQRIIDDGTATFSMFANAPATALVVEGISPANVEVTGSYADYNIINSEGTFVFQSGTQANVDTSPTTFRAVIESDFGVAADSMVLSGGSEGTPDDRFSFSFQCEEPSQLTSVTVEFLLEKPAIPGAQVEDYFTYTWNNGGDQNPFNQSFNSWSSLGALRKEFERKGTNAELDWNAIQDVRFTAVCVAEISLAFYDGYFNGGTGGPLNGTYEWLQVNVAKREGFITRSVASPVSSSLVIRNSSVQITPIDPTVGLGTEWWIYRRNIELDSQFALVRTGTGTTPFTDDLDDLSTFNPLNPVYDVNMRSISPTVLVDDILSMVGPINGRMIYFTFKEIIFSEQYSPGTYNIQQVRSFSGDLGEVFLWATQVGRSTVMVGTSKDVYVIEGTFDTLPDGFIDVWVNPLGVASPPISFDVTKWNNNAVYMASDGWRMTSPGGDSQLLPGINTDILFDGQTRYGYLPTTIYTYGAVRYSCTVNKNELYCVNPTDLVGGRYVQVYDFTRQYWRPYFVSPALVFSEEDENLIGFWGDDQKLRNFNLSTSKLLDGSTKQQVRLISPIFFGGTLRQRKDGFTVRLNVFTGSDDITFTFTGASGITVTKTINTGALTEVFVNLGATVEKWWYFTVTGDAPDFKLADISVDFDMRPIPLTHLRIPPQNFGSMARKRLSAMPFQVDTLGSEITITPVIDNAAGTPLTFTSSYMKTGEYLTSTAAFFDMEWVINSATGQFEWAGFLEPKHLQVLPELIRDLRSIETNFGSNGPKQLSSWPIQVACLGDDVTFTVYADGVAAGTLVCSGNEKKTYTLFFNPPIQGTDFHYTLESAGEFELYDDGVQSNGIKFSYVFKKPSTFSQVGPLQIFRYGKIKAIEVRLMATDALGTVEVKFDNEVPHVDTIVTTPDVDLAYLISVPKTTAGSILTVTFATVERHFFQSWRVLHSVSGEESDLRWSAWDGN